MSLARKPWKVGHPWDHPWWFFSWALPSGKRLQKTMERSTHAINGKTHYFDLAIFNSYVKLPEGTSVVVLWVPVK